MQTKNILIYLILGIGLIGCAQNKIASDLHRNPANELNDEIVIEPFTPEFNDNTSYTVISESNRTAPIQKCGGSVTLKGQEGNVYHNNVRYAYELKITGSRCGQLSTMYGRYTLGGEGNHDRYMNTWISTTPGWHKFLIGGKAYMDSDGQKGEGDVFYVMVRAKAVTIDLRNATKTSPYDLPTCGGHLYGLIANGNKNVNLIVSNTNCTRFDILGNNGESLNYDSKPIPSSGSNHSASFTIPPKLYEYGSNGMLVRFYTPYGTEDRVKVKFQTY